MDQIPFNRTLDPARVMSGPRDVSGFAVVQKIEERVEKHAVRLGIIDPQGPSHTGLLQGKGLAASPDLVGQQIDPGIAFRAT